jgi:hypothetical protein
MNEHPLRRAYNKLNLTALRNHENILYDKIRSYEAFLEDTQNKLRILKSVIAEKVKAGHKEN